MGKPFVSKELDGAFGAIRELTLHEVVQVYPADTKSGVRTVRTPQIEITLGRARRLLLAAMMPSTPDGFPTKTPANGDPGAGKGGGSRMGIPYVDDAGDGQVDWVPTSSTEQAALFVNRWQADPVRSSARKVNHLVLQLAAILKQLDKELAGHEQLQSTADVADPPMCWVAQVRYQMRYDEEWDVKSDTHGARTTKFEGMIDEPFDEPRRVCNFVYRFVQNHKRLPTHDEMLQQLARGVVAVANGGRRG